MCAQKTDTDRVREIRNAKVRHHYFVGDTYEAGIQLKGTEIKSIRLGKAQINESFVRFDKGAPYVYQAHIEEYAFGNIHNHNPVRPRKLLLHARENERIRHAMEADGMAVIPTRIYFKGGLIKIEIALCKGKKLYDKREDVKKKEAQRETDRAMNFRRA